MRAVSDASPLIALARIGHLDQLGLLFEGVHISKEVVVAGAGLPGASAVSKAGWIHVSIIRDTKALANAIARTGLGAGETSTIQRAKKLGIELVLMDEWRGRRAVKDANLSVVGCVGILEELYRGGRIADLRHAYVELLSHEIRIDLGTLHTSLLRFELPPL